MESTWTGNLIDMAHFAELDEDSKVINIVVVADEVLAAPAGREIESKGIDFLEKLYGHRRWAQTSYTGRFRSRYAMIGGTFDSERNWFCDQKPFDKWKLNVESGECEPPVKRPAAEYLYEWDTDMENWIPGDHIRRFPPKPEDY